VSSESSCAVRLARHSPNAWARHVERVESCRVESSRAKWNLGFSQQLRWGQRSRHRQLSGPSHLTDINSN